MSSRIKKYRNELCLLGSCEEKTRKILFKHHDGEFIRALVDAIWTTLEEKVPLSLKKYNSIKESEPLLRRICDKNKTVNQKRRVLCTSQGGKAAANLIRTIKEHF